MPFKVHGRACANRAAVLAELMRVAVSHSGAQRGTIQLRDEVHGGLRLEGRRGFSHEFVDASATLAALTRCAATRSATMAAIKKAYEDAGQQMPEDLNSTNLR